MRSRRRDPYNGRIVRDERAFSLVSVVILAMVATMWLAASYSAIYSVYYQVNSSKFDLVLRNSAEAGLDYVVKKIGEGITNPPAWERDDTTADTTYSTFVLTPSDLGIQDGQNERVKLNVTIKNLEIPASSFLGGHQATNFSPSTVVSSSDTNNARVVEIRAYFEGAGFQQNPIKRFYRSIVSFSQPAWEGMGDNSAGGTSGGGGPSYFLFPAFGSTALTVGANSQVLDGPGQETVGSNGANRPVPATNSNAPFKITGDQVSITTTVAIGAEAANSDIGAVSTSTPGNSMVFLDTLSVNGDVDGFYSVQGGAYGSPNTNVFKPGLGDPIQPQSTSVVPHRMAPAPSSPVNAADLGAISLSGSNSLNFTNSPGGPNDIGPSSGSSFDFKVNSLSLADTSSITVSSDVSVPVRIFVEGPSPGDTAISLGGKSTVSGASSSKIQIFYNGTKPVDITNNAFANAGIYAPNARVNIGDAGRASPTAMTGSAIGDNVIIQNANVSFSQIDGGDGNGGGGLMDEKNSGAFGPSSLDESKGQIPLTRKTWEEMSYAEYLNKGGAPF